ncbi:filamentous hemagglutinin N-terminal domain-containing protein [Lusitaniella coriacea LEGE 07157]|uniref:Filamentous hemagglutinin N-terminal domain-containing protein n=1 Tax=Lusitaniella coriacea LEGE 07157 TaxID=945747 RepID=A0A8J7DZ40_9CYAN|nr:filamentous hemagglutinin N-terminal domain-containing protein [Lusitaniella coriacea]MBE9118239.1 filamentous hemagglutinin N-terminal domain-containing protein [Lusitaniella coriacea LEGE 07157]
MKYTTARSILPSLLILTLGLSATSATAQIASDGTTNTIVVPAGNIFTILGGTTAGSNLFHSFSQFSVPTGGTAFFGNDANIANIFARVTGGSISNIDGIIATQNPANLFLLNPNGIIFGPNATLAIRGSFFASSAESIVFKDGVEFSAAQPSALLSVNVPVGLQMGSNPGSIINQSRASFFGQTVGLSTIAPKTTIGLVGGEVNLTGGGITAVGGRIEIGAVGSNSFVGLVPDAMGYRLNYNSTNSFADINLSQQAFINGLENTNVQLRGDRVRLTEGANIVSLTTGNFNGGTINIDARQIEMDNRAGIVSITTTTTTGATINLRASESMNLVGVGSTQALQDTSAILQGTFNPANVGTTITSVTTRSGTAGKINIESPAISFSNGGLLVTTTIGSGTAGSLQLNATNRITVDSASVFSGPVQGSTGNGGSIAINATDIILSDSRPSLPSLRDLSLRANAFRSAIASSTFGTGAAGDIDVQTKTLRILDGSGITNNSIADIAPNAGAGGNLSIVASDWVEIQGTSRDGVSISELDSSTDSTSRAGNLTVSTGRLLIRDSARITAATAGGDGGRIALRARDSITLNNRGAIVTSASNTATGNSGSILLDTGNLNLTDSQIAANNLSSGGQGGSLNISTRQNLKMTRSSITATTTSGNGGDINLRVGELLLMRDNSLISTTAGQSGAGGNGGNINITAPSIVGVPTENSDITANAFTGDGGNIQITTNNIFGLQFRPQLTPKSDITASSQFGVNGTVTVNRLDVDPAQGLTQLSVNLTDPSERIISSCAAAQGNRFIVTGRGGFPPNPNEPLRSSSTWSDIRDLSEFRGETAEVEVEQAESIEANSWRINEEGNVELVAVMTNTEASTPTINCAEIHAEASSP